MIKLTDILRESVDTRIPVYYTQEAVASYSGQTNYELGMYRVDGEGKGEGIIGLVEYAIFDGEITVSMITVLPEYRRRGVGSRLIQKMKESHPNAKYKPSMKTDLGVEFKHKRIAANQMDWI
jgi:ribosomal protein S18 acetylase RimI-like enzyme